MRAWPAAVGISALLLAAAAVGMTLKQVRKTLGAPESVIERRQLPFGKRWVEYSWNLTEWRVAFLNGRVVRLGTSVRTEKTEEGIGVGTAATRVTRAYASRCGAAFNLDTGTFNAQWCVVSSRGGARTAFVLRQRCKNSGVPRGGECIDGYRPAEVSFIYIFAAGEQLPVRFGG